MFKNIFAKICDFIQWTKKWHITHLIIVPPFVANSLINVLQYLMFFEGDTIKDRLESLLFFNLYGYIFFICVVILPCLLAYIIVLIYILVKKKPIYISNNFLLYNKFYHFIYILSTLQFLWFIFAIFCMIFQKIFYN